ncbi:MAG: glycosyltransferase family 2 protein [Pseudomonadota bacterium]|nr:glycosyltransferase family 2 protein [Pseudomonadota bacterium]
MAQLSVILITKNESANIDACLASVAFADEWIVVDGGSSDDTVARARAHGATVVVNAEWPGFGPQKQRALELARGEWVLAVDADERVGAELASAIRAVVAAAPAGAGPAHQPAQRRGGVEPAAYELSRLSRFCGRWIRHGDWYPDRVVRLFRRDAARFSADRVHEHVLVEGRIGRLAGELLHETMPSLDDALVKLNRYSSDRAADQFAAGRRGGLGRGLAHAGWAFLRSYVLRRGFLDGAPGFVIAAYIAEGTYYRYLKLAEHARLLPAPH